MVPRAAEPGLLPTEPSNGAEQAIPLPDLWKPLPPSNAAEFNTPGSAPAATREPGWRTAEKTGESDSRQTVSGKTPEFLPPVSKQVPAAVVASDDAAVPAADELIAKDPIADIAVATSPPSDSGLRSPEIVRPVPEPYLESREENTGDEPAVNVARPSATPDVSETFLAPPPVPTREMLPGRFRSAAAEQGLSVLAQPDPIAPAPPAEVVVPPAPGVAPTAPLRPYVESSPRGRFRKISEIQPFYDYTPGGGDPAKFLCPIPVGSAERDPLNVCPEPIPLPEEGSIERYFAHVHYYWEPSNLFHNPLYFEDVALERYGHTYPDVVQPFVSLGKFGVQVVGLPYTMLLDRPMACQYALGYYRPGDCAPYLTYQVPINLKAAAAAGGIYTGLFFLFP